MSLVTPTLALLLALLPGVPIDVRSAAGASIELTSTPWRVGEALRSTNTSHSAMKTQIFSEGRRVQEFEVVEDRSSVKTLEILGADGAGPTRLRVTYHALRFLQAETPAEDSETPRFPDEAAARHPLAGRTFVLARTARGYRVLDEAEKATDDAFAALVLEEEGIQGTEIRRAGDLLARALAGRSLPLDAAVEIEPGIARSFVDGHADLAHVSMTVTPRATRDVDGRACHVFEARLRITDEGGSDRPLTSIDLSGEVWFEVATGRYAGIELAGRLRLGDATADLRRVVEITGEGPWSISERVAARSKSERL